MFPGLHLRGDVTPWATSPARARDRSCTHSGIGGRGESVQLQHNRSSLHVNRFQNGGHWFKINLGGCSIRQPALAVQAPAALPELAEDVGESNNAPGFLDNIFWMAAPKSRRTIEVNRCRRRNPRNMIKIKTNIDVCPACGHVKQKHVLCEHCYAKVKRETSLIRAEIKKIEGGPFNTPTVETLVLYQGEKPREQDQGKRIIERNRKRPSWFPLN
ncbi:large ribosomal subunit protein bL32m isoform X1 [Alligator mississippiensis]|uniref:large ribosomal subunit protein bL32m isoform X1 n=1 Tax=Alligator mississippiensis TaxID=8496 RepID=UPI000711537D|nr:large ribosomal subunit protein bL32m isoform X1 [Alligator mississippiensis]